MGLIKVREPAVAGSFYPSDKNFLIKTIEDCINHKFGPKKIQEKDFYASVVPHAGYIYSGPVAAWTYSSIKKANYIIVGPNHYGVGFEFSTLKDFIWKTPLGEVLVDNKIVEKMIEKCKVENDFRAHEYEHSIEVQLPFLQYRFKDFKFVPISIIHSIPSEELLEKCKELGKCLAKVVKESREKWILIASSDFSHYIPHSKAKKIDFQLIREIEKMREEKFWKKLIENQASVCGYCPIVVAISFAREMGAKKGKLLQYKTSGDITKDKSSVVGYASIIFY